MKSENRYRVRPIFTWSCIRRRPVKESFFILARIIGSSIPNWMRKELIPRKWWFGSGDILGSFNGEFPIAGMMIESLEAPPLEERLLVSSLIPGFQAMKLRQNYVSSPYLPGADWKKLLDSQWSSVILNLNNLDVTATFLRNFFRNQGLSGFWGFDKMYQLFSLLNGSSSIGRARLMQEQFEVWRNEFPETLVKELDAPQIGNPWGYVVEDSLLYEPVFEYHYQANYFHKLLSSISSPVIIEIGGGFGGLAYQIIKKIPKVKYIGFDLPENIFLQSYYLKCAFPEANILTYHEGISSVTRDDLDSFDIILLPNFMLPQVELGLADLIVNIRSLSEMPFETIQEYLHQVDRLGPTFFFHENIYKRRLDEFHGIPSSEFPSLQNLSLVAQSESRWPKYQKESGYPCRENLFIHNDRMHQKTSK